MNSRGADTRARIMDAAEELVLRHGFAGTSVDTILERVELTKGAFFHHFESKGDLAHALIERFGRADAALLQGLLERAERLSRDPAQQMVILVGLMEEEAEKLTAPSTGCLFASYCYEAGLFDEEVHALIAGAFREWRERLGAKIRAAMEARAPRLAADPEDVADMLTTVSEGAFILSRALKEPDALARQLRQYRNYLELLLDV